MRLIGKEISRVHAEFCVEGPIVTVRDLGSKNGVYVNSLRVDVAPIRPGDVLRCGEWIGVVSEESDDHGFREIAKDWFGGSRLAASVSVLLNAPADLPIVVQGETGTGKECAARAIHEAGKRTGQLVAVNCAALPVELAESQLFGHKRGAFTSADKSNVGLIRSAHGGTLFLDEVQDLPLTIQAKLLRAIDRREVVPVGESTPIPVDLRIVTATQVTLADLAAKGTFRQDLLARLDGYTLVLPPLRERREDIAPLFFSFFERAASLKLPEIESRMVEQLCLYHWPLNVRELLQLTRQLAALHGREPLLTRAHLPSRFSELSPPSGAPSKPPPSAKRAWRPVSDDAEFEALRNALGSLQGNVSRAAASIGISRARAYRLLSAHPDWKCASSQDSNE